MIASARQRAAVSSERPAVPRISDLGHLYSSSLGKLELDLMGSHQMSERQILDSLVAEAVRKVFEEYVDRHGLEEIGQIFCQGVKIEVGDLLPSAQYTEQLKRVRPRGTRPSSSTRPATRRSGRPASSSSSPASTPPTRSPAPQTNGRIRYET